MGKKLVFGKSDISHAFRNLPIAMKFWKFLIMKAKSPIDDKVYYFVDKCLPFGASISCAIFQEVSDALAHLVKFHSEGKENINYLDDFLFIDWLKKFCNQQLRTFMGICDWINLPVATEKTEWAMEIIEFLGLLIDGRRNLICIPASKIEQAKYMLDKMLSKRKATLRELQQLCGFLNFLNKCIVPGRAFMRRMYAQGKNLTKPHHHFNISAEFRMDLTMWRDFLEHPAAFSRSFFDLDEELYFAPQDFFTDASSTKGCGGYHLDQWFILEWPEEFLTMAQPSINYLELYALTLGILTWGHWHKNRNIVIFCDNQSVIQMVNKVTSSCANCMVLIRFIVLHCMIHNIRIRVKYVKSQDNTFADLLSRMKYKEFRQLSRRQNKIFKNLPEIIPECLWPMEKIWITARK